MTIKRLTSKVNEQEKGNELNFRQGFNFGMGFMTAALIFSILIAIVFFCGSLAVLFELGELIGG